MPVLGVSYETACDILLCIFSTNILVGPCTAFECRLMQFEVKEAELLSKTRSCSWALKIFYLVIIFIHDYDKF